MTHRTTILALILLITAAIESRAAQPFHIQTEGEGRPVYLIPGLASPGSVWDDLGAHLRRQGYQTRTLTLAGFAGQPSLETEYFLPTVRDALAVELAISNNAKPIIIGHSLGGFLAFWLAVTEPDSIAGFVAIDAVPYLGALADPSATPETNAVQAEQMAIFMGTLTPEQFAAQNRMAFASMIKDPEQAEQFAALGGLSDPVVVGRAVAEMLTTDIRPLLNRIKVPAVLIQAADSGSSETGQAMFATQIADTAVRHVVASNGRHFVQLDDPAFVAAEVDRLLAEIDHE